MIRYFALFGLLALCGGAVAQEADVAIELVGAHDATPGDRLAYRVSVLNSGPDQADTADWTLTLPMGLRFASLSELSGSSWNCTTPAVGSDGVIECDLAQLAAGARAEFEVQFDLDGGVVPGTELSLPARTTTLTIDRAEENDATASAVYAAIARADTYVELAAAESVLAGENVTYTLQVGNAGPATADTVDLTQALPGTMTFVSLQLLSGPTPACMTPAVGAGGTLSCSWAQLAAGEVSTLQLVGQVPPGTPSGTEFQADASLIAASADANEENRTASRVTTVSAVDLSVLASAPATANAGSQVSYTLTVANAGPDVATGVNLRTAVPAGSTLQSFAQTGGPGFACLQPVAGSGGGVDCTVQNFPGGASATFVMTVTISQAFAHNTALRLQAQLSVAQADTDAANNSGMADVTVANTVDLALGQTGPASANAGRDASYRLTVSNSGPDAGRNVVVSNPIPANTRFVSAQQVSGSGFACAGPAVGASSGTVTCSGASLAAGASVAFDVVLRVAETVADGGSIGNSASVSNDVPDSAGGNNSSMVTTAVVNRANLQASVSAPAQVSGGATMVIDITARNLGASPAQAVALGSATPNGTTFVALAQISGPTFACVSPALDAAGAIACTIGSLDADAVAVFRLTVQVPSNLAAGSAVNYGASLVSSTVDPIGGNNSATGSSTVVPRIDLQLSLSNGRTRVLPDQDLLYALVASNAGPGDATGAALAFQVPAGLVDVAWACVPAQSTASCPSPSSGAGTLAAGVTLPAGTHLRFDLIGTVSAAIGATLVARAEIATPAGHSETALGNNQATDSDPVSAPVLFADGFESNPPVALTVAAAREVADP